MLLSVSCCESAVNIISQVYIELWIAKTKALQVGAYMANATISDLDYQKQFSFTLHTSAMDSANTVEERKNSVTTSNMYLCISKFILNKYC